MKAETQFQELTVNCFDDDQIEPAIEKAISYLKKHQYPYGEFCSYYAPDDPMLEWCVPCSSIFPTALIVNSLLPLKGHKDVQKIFKKSTSFFQYQVMRGGAMNYFTRWNQYFSMCSADIDDTIFVADFFRSQKIDYTDPLPILLANRAKNGLFYTWFSFRLNRSKNRNFWLLLLREFRNPIGLFVRWKKFGFNSNDIDGVVNANLLYYLGETEITKPIISYLVKIVEDNREDDCDKWYRNPLVFYYFYSRNVKKGIKQLASVSPVIIKRISEQQKGDGSIGSSSLETALAISTLINLGVKESMVSNAIGYLLNAQEGTGEWARHLLYYSGPKKEVGWGSEELTTGFCIEALHSYLGQNDRYET